MVRIFVDSLTGIKFMKKTEFKNCQASFYLLDVTTIVKIRNKNVRRHINNYEACSSLLIV